MRTSYFVALGVCAGLAFMMLAGSGYIAAVGGGNGGDLVDRVDTKRTPGVEGGTGSVGDGNIIGIVIDSITQIGGVLSIPLRLPSFITNTLGFPTWFAEPAGRGIQLALVIGMLQFAAGRIYR